MHTLITALLFAACSGDDEPKDPGTTDTEDTPTDTGDTGASTTSTGDTGTTGSSITWLNQGGGLGDDEWLNAVAQLPDGPIVALGQTQSLATWWPGGDGEATLTAEGAVDGVVLFVDPDSGALEQLLHLGGTGTVQTEGVATAGDRIALLVGYEGQVTFEGTELAPDGAKGRLVVVLDGAGTLQWSRRIDSEWAPSFWGEVDFDATGALLVGLSTVGDVVVDPGGQALSATGAGGTDSTAVRFAADGTASWVRLVGNGSEQFHGTTLPLADGGYVQTGGFAGTLSLGSKASVDVTAPVGDHDVYVARFDAAGEPAWVTTFGSEAIDAGQALVEASDGAIWVSGQFAFAGGGDLQVDGEVVLEGRGISEEAEGYAARLDPTTGEVSTVVGLVTSLTDSPWLVAGDDGQVVLVGQIFPAIAPGDPSGSWSDGVPIDAEGPSRFWALVGADGTILERAVGSHSAALDATWVDGDLVFGGWFTAGASFGVESLEPTPEGGSLDAMLLREQVAP